MGYIKYKKPNKLYQVRNTIGSTMNERKDCTVIAVSIACNVSYQVAHKALKVAGRRSRCGCKLSVTKKAIKALGYKIRQWSQKEMRAMMVSYGLSPSKTVRHITTHHPRQVSQTEQVAAVWQETHNNMIFVTAKHMLAFKDHVVSDWSINKALYVQRIWEIDKIEEAAAHGW